MKRLLFSAINRLGFKVTSNKSPLFYELPPNVEPEFIPIWEACRGFTMTSPDCIFALFHAVKHVVNHEIPGDIVECGVFRGGSIMACANALHHFGDHTRALYLYDTFAGMTAPTERDVDFADRRPADHLKAWSASRVQDMANCPLDAVRANLATCPYPQDRCVFVQGPVEQTIPGTIPEKIAILRLDTDWYESTKHEMEHLFPRLSPGGVLIIDDYGFWRGSREAVDEYLKKHRVPMLLTRIDRAGAAIGVKL